MASGTADLQRDLGGAIMQSIFGALLAAGYAAAFAAAIAASPQAGSVPSSVSSELEMSYAGAQTVAKQYPQYATQITAAAKTSFLAGDQYAYLAGLIAVLLGAALVFLMFPKKDAEQKMLAEYAEQDAARLIVSRLMAGRYYSSEPDRAESTPRGRPCSEDRLSLLAIPAPRTSGRPSWKR